MWNRILLVIRSEINIFSQFRSAFGASTFSLSVRWSLSRYFLAVSSASTLVILLLATIKRPGDPPPMEFKSFTPGSTKNPRRSVAINSVFPFSRKRPGKKAGEGGRKGEKRSNYFPLAYPPHRRFIIYLDKKFARGDSVRRPRRSSRS